jgi:hypothetical protein
MNRKCPALHGSFRYGTQEKAMRKLAHIAGMLMFAVSAGAFAADDPESVSLQDRKPECRERHPTVPPEECMIQDRLPPQTVRRAGQIIITAPPPAAGERQTAPAVPPTAVRPAPASR